MHTILIIDDDLPIGNMLEELLVKQKEGAVRSIAYACKLCREYGEKA